MSHLDEGARDLADAATQSIAPNPIDAEGLSALDALGEEGPELFAHPARFCPVVGEDGVLWGLGEME